jgi:hypothetical protein
MTRSRAAHLQPATTDADPPPCGVRLTIWEERGQPAPGCLAYGQRPLRLPAGEVLSQGIGTLDKDGQPHSPDPFPGPRRGLRRRRSSRAPRPNSQGFSFEQGGSLVFAQVLVGETVGALAAGVRTLREVQDPDVERLRSILDAEGRRGEEALAMAVDPENPRPYRPGAPPVQAAGLFRADVFAGTYPLQLETPEGTPARARGLEAFPLQGLTAPLHVELRGRLVPRRTWIVPGPRRGRVIVHDGRRLLGVERSLRNVPAALLDALDQNGKVTRARSEAVLPSAHLVARCVVRVPGRAEAEALGPAATSGLRLRRAAFRRPALARSCDDPLPLPRRSLVVDDPTVGLWIRERIVDGVFLPGEPTRPLVAGELGEHPEWLALCDPAGL